MNPGWRESRKFWIWAAFEQSHMLKFFLELPMIPPRISVAVTLLV
jgi:hypothetical protein